MGELGFYGANLEGYGCAGMSNVEYGLVMQELERGDSGLRSFVSVQSALVMYPIYTFGSEEQKNTWLPALATGEKLGCFGLTEPGFGSNPAGMTTRARKSGDEYILNGEKMWITSGSIADVAVIWAKLEDENGALGDGAESVRGFLVETDRPGFSAHDIHGKWSLRASVTSGLTLEDVHVPAANLLPGATGLKAALMCLNQARYGISWGAIGAAMDCYSTALNTPRPENNSTISPSPAINWCRKSWCGWRAKSQRRSCSRCMWAGSRMRARWATSTSPWPSETTCGWRSNARGWPATFWAPTASPRITPSCATA